MKQKLKYAKEKECENEVVIKAQTEELLKLKMKGRYLEGTVTTITAADRIQVLKKASDSGNVRESSGKITEFTEASFDVETKINKLNFVLSPHEKKIVNMNLLVEWRNVVNCAFVLYHDCFSTQL